MASDLGVQGLRLCRDGRWRLGNGKPLINREVARLSGKDLKQIEDLVYRQAAGQPMHVTSPSSKTTKKPHANKLRKGGKKRGVNVRDGSSVSSLASGFPQERQHRETFIRVQARRILNELRSLERRCRLQDAKARSKTGADVCPSLEQLIQRAKSLSDACNRLYHDADDHSDKAYLSSIGSFVKPLRSGSDHAVIHKPTGRPKPGSHGEGRHK